MNIAVVGLLLALISWNEVLAAEVAPSALTFKTVQGGASPTSQTVTLSKGSKRSSSWNASDNAAWLSVTPATGSITSSTQVSIAVNNAGLTPGVYSATVQLAITKGGTISLPVTLTVESATPIATRSVTLGWNPNSESDLAGYKLYVGNRSGSYGAPITVGNTTTYTLPNLTVGTTYFFALTAYDINGNESVYSNEASTSIY